MSLPSQESQGELNQNQCSNSTVVVHNVGQTPYNCGPLATNPGKLTRRSLNSQICDEVQVETGSVAQNEDGRSSSSPRMLVTQWWSPSIFYSSGSEQCALTEDLTPTWTSKTDMLRPGEGPNELPEPFDYTDLLCNSSTENLILELGNSDGDVETGVRCSEPNQSHQDHGERASDQASNGQKQTARKTSVASVEKANNRLDQAGTSAKARNGQKRKSRTPIIRTEEQENERKRKKRESDKQYRIRKNAELADLWKLVKMLDQDTKISSSFGGIDQMESQTNCMNSELQKRQQGEETVAGNDRLQQMTSKDGKFEEMESLMKKFKIMGAKLRMFEQIKSLLGGVDEIEIEPEIKRLKDIELLQMDNRKEMDSFPASRGSLQQLHIDPLHRQKKEAELDRFEQLKNRYGGIEEMEVKLRRFEQISSEFGGIDEIKNGMNRLKEIEIESLRNERKFFTEPPGSLQDQHGTHPLDLNSDPDTVSDDAINPTLPAAVRGTNTTHDMQYCDDFVDEFMGKLDDDKAMSNVDLSSFKDLDGECEKVGNYNIPLSLVSTARDIIKAKGDITKKSRFGHCVIEPAYVLLCAATKEMIDLSLEQVTEEIMLKWRDVINDAKGLRCDTEFAMEYLRKFAQGYFGLKAKNNQESLEQRMTILKTEEEVLKEELERKTNEMKVLETKEEDLTSELCKDCQKFADKFLRKDISVF